MMLAVMPVAVYLDGLVDGRKMLNVMSGFSGRLKSGATGYRRTGGGGGPVFGVREIFL